MKTNVIHLEAYENLASILEKISWSAPGRILLVFPDRGQVLRNEIEFLQIVRSAQYRGSNLALVTRDYDILQLCQQRNISTFSNLRKAQRSRWKKRLASTTGRPEVDSDRENFELIEEVKDVQNPLPDWARIGLLALGIAAFLLILATFIPRAEIRISPKQVSQEIVIPIDASEDIESIGLTGSMPVHRFSVIIEGSLTISTSGSAIIPDGIASGEITLHSATSEDVFIPAGSVIQPDNDSGIIYHTQTDVLLSIESSTEQVVQIIAQTPGSASNLAAGSYLKLQGIYTEFVKISNQQAISGGSEKETKAANAEDMNSLRDTLISDLKAQGIEQILIQIEEDDLLLNNEITVQRILSEEYFPERPTPSSEITLTMGIEFQALVVQQEDMLTLAKMVLNANLPEGFSPLDETLVVLLVNNPELSEKGHFAWEIVSKRTIEALISPEEMKWGLINQPIDELENILINDYLIAPGSKITQTPDWWPRMPIYPFRITVVIE